MITKDKTELVLDEIGVTIPLVWDGDEVEPFQLGTMTTGVDINSENDLLNVVSHRFYPVARSGVSYNWFWESSQYDHAVEDAVNVEIEMESLYNRPPYALEDKTLGIYPLVQGMAVAWLLGVAPVGSRMSVVGHTYRGMTTWVNRRDVIPWFEFTFLYDLFVHGADVIQNNCVIVYKDAQYHIEIDGTPTPIIKGNKATRKHIEFTEILQQQVETLAKHQYAMGKHFKPVAKFEGICGEEIILHKVAQAGEYLITTLPRPKLNYQFFIEGDSFYFYEYQVEINLTARKCVSQ